MHSPSVKHRAKQSLPCVDHVLSNDIILRRLEIAEPNMWVMEIKYWYFILKIDV